LHFNKYKKSHSVPLKNNEKLLGSNGRMLQQTMPSSLPTANHDTQKKKRPAKQFDNLSGSEIEKIPRTVKLK